MADKIKEVTKQICLRVTRVYITCSRKREPAGLQTSWFNQEILFQNLFNCYSLHPDMIKAASSIVCLYESSLTTILQHLWKMAVLCLEVPEITRNISLPPGYKLGLCNDHVVRTGRGKFTWNQRRPPPNDSLWHYVRANSGKSQSKNWANYPQIVICCLLLT